MPGGGKWTWEYDSLDQLRNANLKRESDSGLYPGRQFHHEYDLIGNRLLATQGDSTADASHPERTLYTPGKLNQYSAVTRPGYAEAAGEAHTAATVKVNGQTAARLGPYFHKRVSVNNSSSVAVTTALNIIAVEGNAVESETRSVLTLPASGSPRHDADGDPTQDGLWNYKRDAENRLVEMENGTAVPIGKRRKLEFTYDGQSRRTRKRVWLQQATAPHAWVLSQDRRFHHHGWNLLAEADPDRTFPRTYTWGIDLSGTLTGAGGTDGLLAVNIPRGSAGGSHLATSDGRGNVIRLINAGTGQPGAVYQYDPYGRLLGPTGCP